MATTPDQAIAETLDELRRLASTIATHAAGEREPGSIFRAGETSTPSLPYLEALAAEAGRALELAENAVTLKRKAAEPLTLFSLPTAPDPDADRSPDPVEPERVARCKSESCRAAIVYLERAGRSHPADATSVRAGEHEFNPKRHVSHFSTCPDAAKFRPSTSR